LAAVIAQSDDWSLSHAHASGSGQRHGGNQRREPTLHFCFCFHTITFGVLVYGDFFFFNLWVKPDFSQHRQTPSRTMKPDQA
jgi:hypothetical protein